MDSNIDMHPAFFRPVNPSMYRRCANHDYRSKCMYMITMRSNPNFGLLAEISGRRRGEDFTAKSYPSRIGRIVLQNILNLQKINPLIKSIGEVIMPDHIHFLLYVTDRIDRHMANYIASFKGECSRSVWEAFPEMQASRAKESLFEEGFNDRIVRRKGQRAIFKHYIDNNPRRLFIIRENPDFFYNKRTLHFESNEYDAYGNFLLLENPIIDPVVVSSKYTPEERERHYETWRENVRQGGVLIGAFKSEAERKIKYGALGAGGKIIQITNYGFGERYKPNEDDMVYCANGQLLYIGFEPHTNHKKKADRQKCLQMNDFSRRLASWICELHSQGIAKFSGF